MGVYNTSSAYDLSVYEAPKQKQRAPQLEVVQRRSSKTTFSAAFRPKSLGAFAIVVTLICLMVYNQVCLNEVTGEINELQAGLTELNSEYNKINSELEAMISLHTLAQRAKDELGLDRVDKYQTKYVNLYEEDKIILSENAPESGFFDGAALKMRAIFDGILEYIG